MLMQMTGPIAAAVGAGLLAGEKAVRSLFDLILVCAILIGLLVLGGVVLMFFRRVVLDKGRRRSTGEALEQLERLHRQGALSDGEFNRARRALLELPAEGNQQADRSVEQTDDEG